MHASSHSHAPLVHFAAIPRIPFPVGLAAVLALLLLTVPPTSAREYMSSTDQGFFQWTGVDGDPRGSANGTMFGTDEPVMRINNGVVRYELYREVHGSWTLSFEALLSTSHRKLWIGMFNADGTEGLGVRWDSGGYADGEGRVALIKFDLASPVVWSSPEQVISPLYPSGQSATGTSLARFELDFDAGAQVLSVSVNGVRLGTAQVPAPVFDSFTHIYARGNTSAYFSEVRFDANRPTVRMRDGLGLVSTWNRIDGRPALPDPYEGGTRFRLNNGVLVRSIERGALDPLTRKEVLPRPLLVDDWTLRFKASHSSRRRALWLGLFDETRSKGYGVMWDSAVSGTGVVTIRKFDLEAAPVWEDTGVAISDPAPSGHDPLAHEMAVFELSWERETHTLRLKVNGVPRAQAVDDSFDEFERLHMRGNTSSYFDDLLLWTENPVPNALGYDIATEGTAVGDGETDNRAALLAAIAAASAQGRNLYVPPGTFCYSGSLDLQNVRVSGAGYKSALKALTPDDRRLHVSGAGGGVSGVRLLSATTARSSLPGSAAVSLTNASDFHVENLHLEGANSAGIIAHSGGASQGAIVNNWISGVLANAVHLTSGSSDVVISRNIVTDTGDDGIAVVSYDAQPTPCHDIDFHYNNISNVDGSGISIGGGYLFMLDHNRVIECTESALDLAQAEAWGVGSPKDIGLFNSEFLEAVSNVGRYDDAASVRIMGSVLDPVENVIMEGSWFEASGGPTAVLLDNVHGLSSLLGRITGASESMLRLEGACRDIRIEKMNFSSDYAYSIFASNPGATGEFVLLDNSFSTALREEPHPSPIDVVHIASGSTWDSVVIMDNYLSGAEAEPPVRPQPTPPPPPELPMEWFMEIHYPAAVVSGNTRPDKIWVGP